MAREFITMKVIDFSGHVIRNLQKKLQDLQCGYSQPWKMVENIQHIYGCNLQYWSIQLDARESDKLLYRQFAYKSYWLHESAGVKPELRLYLQDQVQPHPVSNAVSCTQQFRSHPRYTHIFCQRFQSTSIFQYKPFWSKCVSGSATGRYKKYIAVITSSFLSHKQSLVAYSNATYSRSLVKQVGTCIFFFCFLYLTVT